MQTNVDIITSLASETELFAHVGSTSFSDLSTFPALIVGQRRKKSPEAMSAMHTRNRETWTYEIIILVRNDSDLPDRDNWLSLENLTNTMKKKLVGTSSDIGQFFLSEEHQDEAMISGQECLMGVIDVEIDLTVQYS